MYEMGWICGEMGKVGCSRWMGDSNNCYKDTVCTYVCISPIAITYIVSYRSRKSQLNEWCP